MDYDDYTAAISAFSALPASARVEAYRNLPEVADGGPLSAWEQTLADDQIATQAGQLPWLAIGEDGLEVGGTLLPDRAVGATKVSITDVPYWAETAFEGLRQTEDLGLYTVEPQGPITVDPVAFRVGLLCMIDATLSKDAIEVSQALTEAACCYYCEAAKVVQVLDMPENTGSRH